MEWTFSNNFSVGNFCCTDLVSQLSHLTSLGTLLSLDGLSLAHLQVIHVSLMECLLWRKRHHPRLLSLGMEFSPCMGVWRSRCPRLPTYCLMLLSTPQSRQPGELGWALRLAFPMLTKGHSSEVHSWPVLSLVFVLKQNLYLTSY